MRKSVWLGTCSVVENEVQEAVGDVGVGRVKPKLSFFLFALGFTV